MGLRAAGWNWWGGGGGNNPAASAPLGAGVKKKKKGMNEKSQRLGDVRVSNQENMVRLPQLFFMKWGKRTALRVGDENHRKASKEKYRFSNNRNCRSWGLVRIDCTTTRSRKE